MRRKDKERKKRTRRQVTNKHKQTGTSGTIFLKSSMKLTYFTKKANKKIDKHIQKLQLNQQDRYKENKGKRKRKCNGIRKKRKKYKSTHKDKNTH